MASVFLDNITINRSNKALQLRVIASARICMRSSAPAQGCMENNNIRSSRT